MIPREPPQAQIDQAIYAWQEYFNQNDKTTHWTFEKIEYRPLDQIQADKTINQKAILSIIQPQNMGGTMYEPSLKIIGFITATFKQDSSKTASIQPVGIAPDGTAKLVLSRPVK